METSQRPQQLVERLSEVLASDIGRQHVQAPGTIESDTGLPCFKRILQSPNVMSRTSSSRMKPNVRPEGRRPPDPTPRTDSQFRLSAQEPASRWGGVAACGTLSSL